jgi:hypothetical protein
MASAESKSLIQKLGIMVVPLASKGLLRSEDVRLVQKQVSPILLAQVSPTILVNVKHLLPQVLFTLPIK